MKVCDRKHQVSRSSKLTSSSGSGYVRAVGPGVTVAKAGDPVLCSFAFCENCAICKDGHVSYCNTFTELNFGPSQPQKVFQLASKSGEPEIDGTFFGQSSFANYSIVKQCSIVNATGLVNDKKDLQLFAPLGCGIQTGSGTVVNVAKAEPKDAICIMGLGGVGLSAIMGAKIQGCRMIIGIDRVQSRLDLAKQLGATHVIDGSKLDEGKTLGDVVKELADGVGPTITVDTTGAPVLMDAGLEFTRNHGRYIQVGSPPFDYTLAKASGFANMVAGKQWIGAIEGGAHPPTYVPQMIKWYREGRFPIDKLMKLMPADDFNQALHEMHSGVSCSPEEIKRVLLTFRNRKLSNQFLLGHRPFRNLRVGLEEDTSEEAWAFDHGWLLVEQQCNGFQTGYIASFFSMIQHTT